jgi:hypothetical protein
MFTDIIIFPFDNILLYIKIKYKDQIQISIAIQVFLQYNVFKISLA